MTPRGLSAARTPNIDELKQNGVYTMHAHAVLPTVSVPNWASLLMGAGPEQHGAKTNLWKPHPITRKNCAGPEGTFPTIYGVLKQQRPDLIRAMFANWNGVERLVENTNPDKLQNCKNAESTVKAAVEYLKKNKPNLLFIYLDLVDETGHRYGFDSTEYTKSIEKADKLIGKILDSLRKAKMMDSAAILVTADHGGKGKKHGGSSREETEIPWILSGPGMIHGKELTGEVNIYDTAPTIAHIFGLTTPACWKGVPITEAFKMSVEESAETQTQREH